jgi:hypothetical protein
MQANSVKKLWLQIPRWHHNSTKYSSNVFSSCTQFSLHIYSSFAVSGQTLFTHLDIFLFLAYSFQLMAGWWLSPVFSPTNRKALIHTHCEKCHIFDLVKAGIFGIPKRLFWTLSHSSLKTHKTGTNRIPTLDGGKWLL